MFFGSEIWKKNLNKNCVTATVKELRAYDFHQTFHITVRFIKTLFKFVLQEL
jgi:hypothetical protein